MNGPVSLATMVNFLPFGRALILGHTGARVERSRGQPAAAGGPMNHASGRTEFLPARIVGVDRDGRLRVEKLGQGGSARLRPLVLADGFVELPSYAGDVRAGEAIAFHRFHYAFDP